MPPKVPIDQQWDNNPFKLPFEAEPQEHIDSRLKWAQIMGDRVRADRDHPGLPKNVFGTTIVPERQIEQPPRPSPTPSPAPGPTPNNFQGDLRFAPGGSESRNPQSFLPNRNDNIPLGGSDMAATPSAAPPIDSSMVGSPEFQKLAQYSDMQDQYRGATERPELAKTREQGQAVVDSLGAQNSAGMGHWTSPTAALTGVEGPTQYPGARTTPATDAVTGVPPNPYSDLLRRANDAGMSIHTIASPEHAQALERILNIHEQALKDKKQGPLDEHLRAMANLQDWAVANGYGHLAGDSGLFPGLTHNRGLGLNTAGTYAGDLGRSAQTWKAPPPSHPQGQSMPTPAQHHQDVGQTQGVVPQQTRQDSPQRSNAGPAQSKKPLRDTAPMGDVNPEARRVHTPPPPPPPINAGPDLLRAATDLGPPPPPISSGLRTTEAQRAAHRDLAEKESNPSFTSRTPIKGDREVTPPSIPQMYQEAMAPPAPGQGLATGIPDAIKKGNEVLRRPLIHLGANDGTSWADSAKSSVKATSKKSKQESFDQDPNNW